MKLKLIGSCGLLALALSAVAQTTPAASGPNWPFPYELDSHRMPAARTGGNCLIKGARVMTAVRGTLENTDVLITNGKIVAIGQNLTAPAGYRTIEAAGRTMTPGIVDGHSHRGSDGTNEGAESITNEVRIGDVQNLSALNVWQALASGHTTAMVLHGSANAIGGESLVMKYKYMRPNREGLIPDAPRQVKFALGENVTRKNSTGTGERRFPLSRMGVEAVYRRAFQDAQVYRQTWADFRAGKTKVRPRRDLRLEGLVDILDKKVWVQCHSYRSDEMLMMARLSQEFGFKIGALQHALEGYKIAPELAAAGVGISIFMDNWSFKVEGYDAIPWNAAICQAAGVNVSINTDGTSGTTALNVDAAKTMRFGGFTEEQALRTITLNPAKQLGIDHRTGSIEVGKDADLVLWTGHPLSPYSQCSMTMIEGEVYFERRDAFRIDRMANIVRDLPRQQNVGEAPLPRANDTYAIVGATLYPVSRAPIANGTIVISRGKITEVGTNVRVPSGATVINGRGLTVFPGFFDAYSTMGLGEISPVATMMDNTELGTVQPDLDAATALWVESAHYGPARYAGITNVFTGPAFGTVSGQGAVIHTWGFTPEELTMSRKAGLMVQLPGGGTNPLAFDACDAIADASRLLGMGGADDHDHAADGTCIVEEEHSHNHDVAAELKELKGDEDLTAAQRAQFYDLLGARQEEPTPAGGGAAAAGSLERIFEDALQYYRDRDAKKPGVGLNLQHEAMRPYLTQRRLMVLAARTPSQIRTAVAVAKKYNLNVVLRGASGAWKEAKLLRENNIPVILTPAGRVVLGANSPDAPWEPYDTPYVTAGILAREGVRFCFGSGGPADVMNLAVRVGQHCAFGLKFEDALRSLTLTPAEVYGVSDKLGSLQTGRLGNLVVTDGDPFQLTTTIRYVFVEGQPRPMVSKHTQLRDKYFPRAAAFGRSR